MQKGIMRPMSHLKIIDIQRCPVLLYVHGKSLATTSL